MKLSGILDINKTICKELFEHSNYPWEVLPKISEYIIALGNSLDENNYTEIEEHIWVGSNVVIDKLSTITAPCIIDNDTIIRPGAYIRGNVIIGKNCVIGNSTEIKNAIIFDKCQLPHYNYVGDSVLGYHVHLGAGVILSNLKSDGTNVDIRYKNKKISTGMRKMGSIIGDNTEVGCNSVLYPGTVVGKNTNIYPLTRVRGIINSNSILKDENVLVEKENR